MRAYGSLLYRRSGRSKFNAAPTRCSEGRMHQSGLEARRCTELHLMERAGVITNLRAHPQVRFRLEVDGHHICDYMADFCYYDNERRAEIVEDVKGMMTDVARMKMKLMEAVHGVEVELVRHVRKASGWR